jgi:hypothetical protein
MGLLLLFISAEKLLTLIKIDFSKVLCKHKRSLTLAESVNGKFVSLTYFFKNVLFIGHKMLGLMRNQGGRDKAAILK